MAATASTPAIARAAVAGAATGVNRRQTQPAAAADTGRASPTSHTGENRPASASTSPTQDHTERNAKTAE